MRKPLVAAALCVVAGAGCVHRFVPAPDGTPLDEVCNPSNGALVGGLDTAYLGRALVQIPKGWTPTQITAQDLDFTRIDAELNVWRGRAFVFPALAPRNAVRCELVRGDTTISIQATRLNGFNYRVDVSWEPLMDGQNFYMQLQTRYVAHLRDMRGMIEGVRFVPDTRPTER
jgi:hypothetical protein